LGIALFKTYPPRTFKMFFRAGGGGARQVDRRSGH
jgi:hypothetical protein